MRLRDVHVVVTGASGGLGFAMADGFVDEGARVTCAARTADRLSDAVETIAAGPGDAIGVPTDVRSPAAVEALVEAARAEHGPVDVLVNNAGVKQVTLPGVTAGRTVESIPVEHWDAVVETNLRGPFLCSRAVLPGMLERGGGRLVHVSSGMGRSGRARVAPYVASKFGLEGFGESLALELAGTGVSSVLLRPGGGVYTERYAGVYEPSDFDRDPSVIVEPAIRLAAGAGANGGRYVATDDGAGFDEYGPAPP